MSAFCLNRSINNLKLSIVIPCYNEEKNIPLLLDKVSDINNESIHFIFVNNGSNDQSKVLLEKAKPLYPNITILNIEHNIGYGHGIVSGLKAATSEFIGWTHADLQTDLNDVIKSYQQLETAHFSANTFIKGRRYGRPIIDVLFTWGMSLFETFYLKTRLLDINAQPTIFHRSFFNNWINPPEDFALDLYAYYKAKKEKLTIIRFPVLFGPRLFGQSHWNTGFKARIKFIKRTIQFSTSLKKRLL